MSKIQSETSRPAKKRAGKRWRDGEGPVVPLPRHAASSEAAISPEVRLRERGARFLTDSELVGSRRFVECHRGTDDQIRLDPRQMLREAISRRARNVMVFWFKPTLAPRIGERTSPSARSCARVAT